MNPVGLQGLPGFEHIRAVVERLRFGANRPHCKLGQHRTIWQEHSAKDFASYESYKRAGILYVFPPFITARMGQKIGRRPQTQLCGAALDQRTWFHICVVGLHAISNKVVKNLVCMHLMQKAYRSKALILRTRDKQMHVKNLFRRITTVVTGLPNCYRIDIIFIESTPTMCAALIVAAQRVEKVFSPRCAYF